MDRLLGEAYGNDGTLGFDQTTTAIETEETTPEPVVGGLALWWSGFKVQGRSSWSELSEFCQIICFIIFDFFSILIWRCISPADHKIYGAFYTVQEVPKSGVAPPWSMD